MLLRLDLGRLLVVLRHRRTPKAPVPRDAPPPHLTRARPTTLGQPRARYVPACLFGQLAPNSGLLLIGRIGRADRSQDQAQGKVRQFGKSHASHRARVAVPVPPVGNSRRSNVQNASELSIRRHSLASARQVEETVHAERQAVGLGYCTRMCALRLSISRRTERNAFAAADSSSRD